MAVIRITRHAGYGKLQPSDIDGLTVSGTLYPDSAVGFTQHAGCTRLAGTSADGGASGVIALRRGRVSMW